MKAGRSIRRDRSCSGPPGGRPPGSAPTFVGAGVAPTFVGAGSPLRVTLLTMLAVSCAPSASQESRDGVDLLVAGGTVVTMDRDFTVHDPGFVAVSEDRIVAVGPLADVGGYSATRTLDATDSIVIPGLINGHQHAPMTLFRGLGSDLKLMDWLTRYIFPAESKSVDRDFVFWGALLAATEMLESGTTTFVDMYYFEEEVARATSTAGMRGILGQTVIGFPAPDYPTPEATLNGAERFIVDWKGDPLVIPAVAPHAPYTCSREVLDASRALAEKHDVPLIIHLAETRDEVRQVEKNTGFRPVAYLNKIGFLVDRLIAAHVVWVDEEEIRFLKERGVGVIHNPESNMKLSSGASPVPLLLAAGVDVGLGTDGAASNNNLDLLQEADTMAKLHKFVSEDPTAIPAREALVAATMGSARALNLDAELGSLEVGKKADLVVLGLAEASAVPVHDPYAQLVYSLDGSAVETVIVNGRVVVENGRITTIDRKELFREVERLRKKVVRALEE